MEVNEDDCWGNSTREAGLMTFFTSAENELVFATGVKVISRRESLS